MTDTQDPRPLLDIALATTADAVAGVRPDQLDLPTPCPELTVRGLSAHLVDVAWRIGDLGRGTPVFDGFLPLRAPAATLITDDEWASRFKDAAAGAAEAWADDARLTALVELPWATLPGAVQLLTYLNELSVHTWDLATATGQAVAWDERVLEPALAAMTVGLPADARDDDTPFDRPIDVPADAPLIDRLVAWSGRQP